MDSTGAALRPPSPRLWIRECTRLHPLRKTARTRQQVPALMRSVMNQHRMVNLSDWLRRSYYLLNDVFLGRSSLGWRAAEARAGTGTSSAQRGSEDLRRQRQSHQHPAAQRHAWDTQIQKTLQLWDPVCCSVGWVTASASDSNSFHWCFTLTTLLTWKRNKTLVDVQLQENNQLTVTLLHHSILILV